MYGTYRNQYDYYFYYCTLEPGAIVIFHRPIYQNHFNEKFRFSSSGLNNAVGGTIDPGYYSDNGSCGYHDGA
jgi:hypothetical protein